MPYVSKIFFNLFLELFEQYCIIYHVIIYITNRDIDNTYLFENYANLNIIFNDAHKAITNKVDCSHMASHLTVQVNMHMCIIS